MLSRLPMDRFFPNLSCGFDAGSGRADRNDGNPGNASICTWPRQGWLRSYQYRSRNGRTKQADDVIRIESSLPQVRLMFKDFRSSSSRRITCDQWAQKTERIPVNRSMLSGKARIQTSKFSVSWGLKQPFTIPLIRLKSCPHGTTNMVTRAAGVILMLDIFNFLPNDPDPLETKTFEEDPARSLGWDRRSCSERARERGELGEMIGCRFRGHWPKPSELQE
jgi:hypothetical protein